MSQSLKSPLPPQSVGLRPNLRRYGRQIRLPEIGEQGQAQLCAAEVALRTTGLSRLIEERYLVRAGLHATSSPASPIPESDMDGLGLRNEAARDVAKGAFAALSGICAVLGMDREGTS